MATVYAAPIEAPSLESRPGEDYHERWQRYEREEQAYIKAIQDLARKNGKHEALGTIVRFPYADGYAQYVLWKVKPLQLVHLAVGDAWDLPDYVTRGIRLSDITRHGGRMAPGGPVD